VLVAWRARRRFLEGSITVNPLTSERILMACLFAALALVLTTRAAAAPAMLATPAKRTSAAVVPSASELEGHDATRRAA
jgi:hypothetical protein